MENTDKRMAQQEKQQIDQVNSLNNFIKHQEDDIKALNIRIDHKQSELLKIQQIHNTTQIEIDNKDNQIGSLSSELIVFKETNKAQKLEIDELNSKLKSTKTKKQHLDREIQQLKEYKGSVQEVTDFKLAKLTEEVNNMK